MNSLVNYMGVVLSILQYLRSQCIYRKTNTIVNRSDAMLFILQYLRFQCIYIFNIYALNAVTEKKIILHLTTES